MSRKKTTTIEKAIAALVEDRDRLLAARPAHWAGSGEGLILHAGNLYRVAPGLDPLIDGPAYHLGAAELVGRWIVSTRDELRAEPAAPPAAEKVARPKRPKKPALERRDRRGRPSAAELRAELPEGERDAWLGVSEAAKAAGVGKDRIRRAIAAGELAVRLVRGVVFVDAKAVGELGRPAPASTSTSSEATDPEAFS